MAGSSKSEAVLKVGLLLVPELACPHRANLDHRSRGSTIARGHRSKSVAQLVTCTSTQTVKKASASISIILLPPLQVTRASENPDKELQLRDFQCCSARTRACASSGQSSLASLASSSCARDVSAGRAAFTLASHASNVLSSDVPLEGVADPAAACGDISSMTSPPSSPRPQAPPQANLQLAFRGFSPGCLVLTLGRSLGELRAWGRRHGGDVAACRCGTFHALQWHLCRQLNKAWLASVQAARPGLTQSAQAELARRTQQHRNSSSCNSESGFSDVLVICRGESNMILSAENLYVH